MDSVLFWIVVVAIVIVVIAFVFIRKMPRGPAIPDALKQGQALPVFSAVGEKGEAVNSSDLVGTAAVILFVRGNWCPFCSKQVEKLTQHYNEIVSSGARLIFVTPKPLETTKRVAEFFKVEFEFWLDDSLEVARSLGLVQPGGVPKDHKEEYGVDTVWPTAIIVDKDGIIRYSKISRFIFDRPDPELLARELKRL